MQPMAAAIAILALTSCKPMAHNGLFTVDLFTAMLAVFRPVQIFAVLDHAVFGMERSAKLIVEFLCRRRIVQISLSRTYEKHAIRWKSK